MSEYVGFDVSKEETSFCVKDVSGKILSRGKVATDPATLFEALRDHCVCPSRIVLETGTLSGWLSRELGKLGIAVDVIDARQANAVMKLQHNKTDANDAALLAEIARTGFCRPVAVKSAAAQEDRILLKARAHLVRHRRDMQNTIRGLLGSLGIRFPKGSGKLAGREALEGRPELSTTIEPLLRAAALGREIAWLDKAVSARAKDDPAVRLLMTVPGVGPVTALAVGRDGLFGAHFQTRRFDAARPALRGRQQLADGGAQGPSAEGLGAPVKKRTSHKKACVALARKLAVILHRMLITGEAFRWPQKEAAA